MKYTKYHNNKLQVGRFLKCELQATEQSSDTVTDAATMPLTHATSKALIACLPHSAKGRKKPKTKQSEGNIQSVKQQCQWYVLLLIPFMCLCVFVCVCLSVSPSTSRITQNPSRFQKNNTHEKKYIKENNLRCWWWWWWWWRWRERMMRRKEKHVTHAAN